MALATAAPHPTARLRRKWLLYAGAFAFVAPALVNFVVFRYVPIASAVYASLFEYSLIGGLGAFIGAEQYARALEDPIFWTAMKVTVLFALLKVPAQVALALGLALLLQRQIPATALVRTAVFLPVVTALVIASILWQMMYHPQQGLINGLLTTLGLPRQPFLTDVFQSLPALALMTVWKDVGFSMVIFLAGLAGIPEVYYEAAAIDGANARQRLLNITLPLLKRTTLFVLVTTTIFAFQVFTPVYVMTRGGPLDATKVIVFYIYQNAFAFNDMGYASALSIIVLFIILAVSLVQMWALRGEHEY